MNLAKALDKLKIASPVSAGQVRKAFDREVRRVQAEGRTSLEKRGEIPSSLADLAEARDTCLDELNKRGSSATPSTASQQPQPSSYSPAGPQPATPRPIPASQQSFRPPQAGASSQPSHAGSPYQGASAAGSFPTQSTWSQPSSPGPVPVGGSSSQPWAPPRSQRPTSSWHPPTQSFRRRSPFRLWGFWDVLRVLVLLFFLFLLSLLPFALVKKGVQSFSGGSSRSSLFGLSRTGTGNGHGVGNLKSRAGSSARVVETPLPPQAKNPSRMATKQPWPTPLVQPSPKILEGACLPSTSRKIASGRASEVFAAADRPVKLGFESEDGVLGVSLSPKWWTRIHLPTTRVGWDAFYDGHSYSGFLPDNRHSGTYELFYFADQGRLEIEEISREELALTPLPPQKEQDGLRAWLSQRSPERGWETVETFPIRRMPIPTPSLVPSETPLPIFTPTRSPSPTSLFAAPSTVEPAEERVALADEKSHALHQETTNDCRLLGTADTEVQLWVVLEEGFRLFYLGSDRVEGFTLPAGKAVFFALLDGKRVARHETTLQSGISYAVVVISKRWYLEVRVDDSIAAYGERLTR